MDMGRDESGTGKGRHKFCGQGNGRKGNDEVSELTEGKDGGGECAMVLLDYSYLLPGFWGYGKNFRQFSCSVQKLTSCGVFSS